MAILHDGGRVRAGAIRLVAALAALLMVLVAASPAQGQSVIDPIKEAQVKAAYLVNFLRYTTFPTDTAASQVKPYHLVILGDETLAQALEAASAAGVAINSRSLQVRSRAAGERADLQQLLHEPGSADLLFVSAEQRAAAAEILAAVQHRPVLTVGEGRVFIEAGGMLGLRLEGHRIVFDANPVAVQHSGLKLSAKVLKLARNMREAAAP